MFISVFDRERKSIERLWKQQSYCEKHGILCKDPRSTAVHCVPQAILCAARACSSPWEWRHGSIWIARKTGDSGGSMALYNYEWLSLLSFWLKVL